MSGLVHSPQSVIPEKFHAGGEFIVSENDTEEQRKHSLVKRISGKAAQKIVGTKYIVSALSEPEGQPLSDINHYHGFHKLGKMEGFMRKSQAEFFGSFLKANPGIVRIAEIGFNGGHSSAVFLGSRSDTQVTSFDIAEHDYVDEAVEYLANKYPGRHQLIKGDSTQAVPQFAAQNPNDKFDLLYIDGGHSLETATADLKNAQLLAKSYAVAVVDDYMPWAEWGQGPAQAWNSAVRNSEIAQIEVATGDNRTWAIGHFLLKG
jgi:hypothetical protein